MEGYWLLWSICIVTILYFSGYQQMLLSYVSTRESVLCMVIILVTMLYEHPLATFNSGSIALYSGMVLILILLWVVLLRNTTGDGSAFFIATVLFSLLYSLFYVIYIFYRGYEPTMMEWLAYSVVFTLVSVVFISKSQLIPTIVLTKLMGDFILYWQQQGQYNIQIGNFTWWEFNIFISVSVICLSEAIRLVVNGVKMIYHHNNRMKS